MKIRQCGQTYRKDEANIRRSRFAKAPNKTVTLQYVELQLRSDEMKMRAERVRGAASE